MKTLTTWMLGGALAASLAWNWKLHARVVPPAAGPCGTSCELGGMELELEPAQRAAIQQLCARSCAASEELERRADERQRELLASLSREEVDPAAAAALVAEISELRRRALAGCVDGILGVREVLSGEQVRALLESCSRTSVETSSCK